MGGEELSGWYESGWSEKDQNEGEYPMWIYIDRKICHLVDYCASQSAREEDVADLKADRHSCVVAVSEDGNLVRAREVPCKNMNENEVKLNSSFSYMLPCWWHR